MPTQNNETIRFMQEPSYEELSVISLDAAIELDRLQRGEEINKGVIDSLVNNLGLRENIASADTLSRLTDPTTVDIYNRTVSYLTNISLNTIDELAQQVQKYANTLTQDISSASKADLLSMRNFCLALHRELLSAIYDKRIEVATEKF